MAQNMENIYFCTFFFSFFYCNFTTIVSTEVKLWFLSSLEHFYTTLSKVALLFEKLYKVFKNKDQGCSNLLTTQNSHVSLRYFVWQERSTIDMYPLGLVMIISWEATSNFPRNKAYFLPFCTYFFVWKGRISSKYQSFFLGRRFPNWGGGRWHSVPLTFFMGKFLPTKRKKKARTKEKTEKKRRKIVEARSKMLIGRGKGIKTSRGPFVTFLKPLKFVWGLPKWKFVTPLPV